MIKILCGELINTDPLAIGPDRNDLGKNLEDVHAHRGGHIDVLQSAQQAGDIITGAGIDYDRGNVSPTEWDLRCDELAHWNRLNEVDSAVFSQRAKSGMFGGLDQEKSACYAKQSLRTPSRLAIFGVEKYFNPLFCMNKAVSVQALTMVLEGMQTFSDMIDKKITAAQNKGLIYINAITGKEKIG